MSAFARSKLPSGAGGPGPPRGALAVVVDPPAVLLGALVARPDIEVESFVVQSVERVAGRGRRGCGDLAAIRAGAYGCRAAPFADRRRAPSPARGTRSTCAAGPPSTCAGGRRAGRRAGRRSAPRTRSPPRAGSRRARGTRSGPPRGARRAWPAGTTCGRVHHPDRTVPGPGHAHDVLVVDPHRPSGPWSFWKVPNSLGAARSGSPRSPAMSFSADSSLRDLHRVAPVEERRRRHPREAAARCGRCRRGAAEGRPRAARSATSERDIGVVRQR